VLEDLELTRGQMLETSVTFAEEKNEHPGRPGGTHRQPLSLAFDRDGIAGAAQRGEEALRQLPVA
jgi:hypothetical protein